MDLETINQMWKTDSVIDDVKYTTNTLKFTSCGLFKEQTGHSEIKTATDGGCATPPPE